MVPVDFTSHTDTLVEYALQIAQAMAAEIKFVHIVESFSGYEMLLVHPSFEQISADLKVRAEQFMANLIDDNKARLADISGEVMVGEVVETLVECASQEDFDMIIVGTHGTKGLEKVLMGSVASKLTHNAPCPVLIVNPISYFARKGGGGDK